MPESKTAAIKNEVDAGAVVKFDFDGVTYTIPVTGEWDIDIIEAYEDGKAAAAARGILGDEQWKKFRAKKRTVKDLNSIIEAMQPALGIEGN